VSQPKQLSGVCQQSINQHGDYLPIAQMADRGSDQHDDYLRFSHRFDCLLIDMTRPLISTERCCRQLLRTQMRSWQSHT
jgi:hypothetical protein